MNFAARRKTNPGRLQMEQRRRVSASGIVTPILIGLLCLGLLLTSYNHKRGNFHRLRSAVLPHEQIAAPIPGPGGQAPIYLSRAATSLGAYPEFVSVTLLPGRGMDVLQITAVIPGRGETPLLHSPAVPDASRDMTGAGPDADGRLSSQSGGAFLAPWAGRLSGTPAPQNAGMLETSWQGHRLLVPQETPGATGATLGIPLSVNGLLLNRVPDTLRTGVLADGQSTQALFHLGSLHGAWPSSLDVTASVELSGHTITLSLTGKNVGDKPMPLGLGWKPYFSIPSGDRGSASIVVPAAARLVVDHHTGLPTGGTSLVDNTPYDFQRPEGTPLGLASLNETYVDLHSAALADGPILELRDPASNYGLRMIPLTDSVTGVHVIAPAGEPWVVFDPETNLPDPFGREWNGKESGMRVLQPGETLSWQVRLEIFSVSGSGTPLTP
jgi:galactose mutarotase-like enzyme